VDHALNSPKPRRVAFDLMRVMRTRYRIDAFQDVYFAIESFDRLFLDTAPDFAPLYAELAGLSALDPETALPSDRPA
jgi:phenylalanine-4-hydroxylase